MRRVAGDLRPPPASGSQRGHLIAPSTPLASIGLVTGLAAVASPGESLAPWTSLRVGGPAELLVRPRTGDALVSVLSRARAEGLPVHVLGGGANTLVGDLGIRGITVKLPPDFFAEEVQPLGSGGGAGDARRGRGDRPAPQRSCAPAAGWAPSSWPASREPSAGRWP